MLDKVFAEHDIDTVMHFAAKTIVPESVADPLKYYGNNTANSRTLLECCAKNDVKHFVFSSTAAVYGPPQYTPVDEAHPLNPISPYGGSKLAAERLLAAYAQTFDFEFAAVRIFNTYGPRQPRYVAYDLMMKLTRDPQRLEVLGTGEQKRDYCYISDTVRALLLAGEIPAAQPEVINVSGGRTITIRELVDLILQTLGLDQTEVVYGLPSWKGDIEVLSGDITKLRGLGWQPTVPLEEGLRRMAIDLGVLPQEKS